MDIKVGTFTFATGVLSQTVTLGFQPKAIVFWSAGDQADNVAVTLPNPSYGFWADCGLEGHRQRSRFNYRTAAIGSALGSHPDYLGSVGPFVGMIRSRSYGFTVDSASATGFTITWNLPPLNGTRWHYHAIGGNEVRAYIGVESLTIPGAAANGYQASVVGVPFRPVGVVAIGTHGTSGAPMSGADVSMGFMDEAGAQFSYAGLVQIALAGTAIGSSNGQYRNDALVAGPTSEMRLVASYTMDGINLLGYEGSSSANARSLEADFLFLSGVRTKASFFQIPTTNITQSIDAGFKPKSALSLGWHLGIQGNLTGNPNPQAPNTTLAGAGLSVGGVNLVTGNRAVAILTYPTGIPAGNPGATPATSSQGMSRTDLFWAATMDDYADVDASSAALKRWVAAPTISGTNVQLPFLGANVKPAYMGLFTLGEITVPLDGSIGVQADLQGSKFGSPVTLTGDIDVATILEALTFGTVGNISGGIIDVAATLTALGIRFDRFLTGTSDVTIDALAQGIRFDRLLTGSTDIVTDFLASKLGIPWENTGAIDAAIDLWARGITFDRFLSGAVDITTWLDAYFHIDLPKVRPPDRDELAGTVNWHINPSAERNLVGWDPEGNSTVTRTAAEQWDGAWAVAVSTAGSALGEGLRLRSVAGLELTGLDVNGNFRVVFGQARLKAAAPVALSIWSRAEYQDGTVAIGEARAITLTTGWLPYSAPALSLDPTKRLKWVETVVGTPTAIAVAFFADGAQIEEDRGQGPTSWVTGSYGRETGYWSGVPDASMSVREPLQYVVHGVGRGGSITVQAWMYRATYDNQWLEDISDAVINAKVTMSPERETTWQLDCTMTLEGWDRITENQDWLAPYLKVTYPDGYVSEGQLGLYFVVPSGMSRSEYGGTVEVTALDPLWLLGAQAFTGNLVIRPGTDRIRAVRQIIETAALTGGPGTDALKRFTIPDSGKEFKRAREWDRKTNRLELANEILESSGFYPLWTTNTGIITSRKRTGQRLANSAPVRAWVAHLPAGGSVNAWVPRLASLKSEVVGAVDTQPLALDNIDEILMINDDPRLPRIHVRGKVKRRRRHNGKTQWVVEGRKGKTRRLYAPLVDDDATAQEVALALADDLSNRVEHVKLRVLPDPRHNYVRNTALLAIWDAQERPVAVGQYIFRSCSWGFTPKTCIQEMELDWVDNGDAEIDGVLGL